VRLQLCKPVLVLPPGAWSGLRERQADDALWERSQGRLAHLIAFSSPLAFSNRLAMTVQLTTFHHAVT